MQQLPTGRRELEGGSAGSSCTVKPIRANWFGRQSHSAASALPARQKLLDRLPVTGEILRGSLLHRTIHPHGAKCAKYASGEGHPLSVLLGVTENRLESA
jgi:hypothetical protein